MTGMFCVIDKQTPDPIRHSTSAWHLRGANTLLLLPAAGQTL